MIICITGNDASGKATQSKILAASLDATLFAFPDYRTTVGKAISGNLKESWAIHRDSNADHHDSCYRVPEVNALVLQSLMTVNRLERMADLKAAVACGHVVLDRYDVDALIYGGLDGLDRAWLERINAELAVKPDIYILLDVPTEEGFRRRPATRDRYEADIEFRSKVRIAYLELFREQQQKRAERAHQQSQLAFAFRGIVALGPRWEVVDGIGTIEEVAERVRKAVHS